MLCYSCYFLLFHPFTVRTSHESCNLLTIMHSGAFLLYSAYHTCFFTFPSIRKHPEKLRKWHYYHVSSFTVLCICCKVIHVERLVGRQIREGKPITVF